MPGGKAVLPWQSEIRSYVARKGRDTAMMPQNVYMNHPYYGIKDTDWRQMALLTDRSLYRPRADRSCKRDSLQAE